MLKDLFQLALTNLFRARGRLFITASGVLIGTTAVILLVGLTIGLQTSAEAGLGDNAALTDITVYPNFMSAAFESEDVPAISLATVEALRQIEGVEAVIPVLPLLLEAEVRIGRFSNSVTVYGIDYALLPYLEMELIGGDWATVAEGQMIVGEGVGDSFIDPNARESWIPVRVDLFAEPSRIIISNLLGDRQERLSLSTGAMIRSSDTRFAKSIFLPFEQVAELNNFIRGDAMPLEEIVFDQVQLRTRGREETLLVVDAIEAMGYATESMGDYLADINNFFTLMRLVLGGVGFVALLIASFGVANTMMMAIIERTSEIGLLKALGARDRDVLAIFLLEAGLVGFVGGLMGIAAALFLRGQINGFIADSASNTQLSVLLNSSQLTGDLVIIPPELLLFGLILATGVGLGAGFFPAMTAAQLSPVIALKQE
jgi:putative ABC transport system permease protein